MLRPTDDRLRRAHSPTGRSGESGPPSGARLDDRADASDHNGGGRYRSRPDLRLVSAPDADAASSPRPRPTGPERAVGRAFATSAATIESDRRRDVARENLEAASDRTLDPLDPRWLVALEAAKSLQGPLLTFEKRRTVLAFANRIGVRPFDANLIIAAMQDRARRGEPLDAAMSTVALTAAPAPRRGARRPHRLATTGIFANKAWMPILVVGLLAAALHGWVIAALLR